MDSRTLAFLPNHLMYSALVTSLTSLSIGYVIGSPNILEAAIRGEDGSCGAFPFTIQGGFPNCLKFSDLIWGFAVGSFCLGACVGGLVAGGIQNKVGRIRTMLISNFIFILGSLILSLTYHQAQFVLGRIVLGLACGLGGVVAPTFLGEITTVQARGTLGTFHQLFIVVGLVTSNIASLAWSHPPGWRVVFAVNVVPPLLQCLLLPTMVESPRYLVSQRRLKEAYSSLQKLRGPENEIDVHKELDEMVLLLLGEQHFEILNHGAHQLAVPEQLQTITPIQQGGSLTTMKSDSTDAHPSNILKYGGKGGTDNQEPYGILELFRSECRGLATIGVLVHFLQQASGINGLVYYSTSFLSDVFGSDNSRYITFGVSCCSLISTILSVYLINRFNRRTLLMASFAGISLSAALLITGAYCNVGHLVAVAVFLYIVSFAFALGPIPWLLLSEMLPTYAVSPASSVATGVNWGTNFIIGLVFPSMTKTLGSGTFILFGAFNIFGIIYIWHWVPETRGRSIEQVMGEKGVPLRSA
ncbi:major facilitator superfamily domain-containing protein [Gamsiella multidivaricata]|uniref:major facilitator superfamily domain-containing protein n=1 Tax=Gamsiella multidivaricata TaxID=101098 RepID=UPI0022207E35|nr:major facilitator superfamily domain-containing protein [Gamsiella multidivaricata]KAI7823261.1 major facilitator superfamily domain-containing protein [Gamsiella multidivaricata]